MERLQQWRRRQEGKLGYILLWALGVPIPVLFVMMRAIRRHYDRVTAELVPDPGGMVLPSRIHAVVLVSRLHRPTIRALAYARATRPDTLTALTVEDATDIANYLVNLPPGDNMIPSQCVSPL